MKILITGGCGFIGSHLAEQLIKEKHKVTIIDNLSGAESYVPKRSTLFQMNVEDKRCETVFRDNPFDCVVHLANKKLPIDETSDFSKTLHENNMGFSHVLHLSSRYKIPKFIHISSTSVYAEKIGEAINENDTTTARTEIGSRFLTREKMVDDYLKRDTKVVTIRTDVVYGPRQNDDSNNYLQYLLKSAQSEESQAHSINGKNYWDFLYVTDFVDGLVRVIENDTGYIINLSSAKQTTSHEVFKAIKNHFPKLNNSIVIDMDEPAFEALDKPVFDNSLAMFELEWNPRKPLAEGIVQTVEWASQSSQFDVKGTVEKQKKKLFRLIRSQTSHDVETVVTFFLAALLTYLMQYTLRINTDFLILYVIGINIFYGMRQGGMAIALAVIARVWFSLAFDNLRAIDLVNDVTGIMYLTMYFIIGISVGYVIDQKRIIESTLRAEIEATQTDLKFVSDLYDKSLEVKSSLQDTIEHYEDSFGKTIDVIKKLDSVEPEFVYLESAGILSRLLKSGTIHIYSVDPTGRYLRLAAVTGTRRYGKSIERKQNSAISQAIDTKTLQINYLLSPEEPMIVAPIINDGQAIAVLLIDELEFRQIKTSLIHTIQVMTLLLSNTIRRAEQYENAIAGQKYCENTTIIREEVFSKLVKSRQEYDRSDNVPSLLLSSTQVVKDYTKFYQLVSNSLRSDDLLGEISPGRIGILLANTSLSDLPTIEERLRRKGISVQLLDRQVKLT